jgi:hypothetical protein
MAYPDSMRADCNHLWDEFLANETRPPLSDKSHLRFHRFNPVLQGDCPTPDENGKLKRWLTGRGIEKEKLKRLQSIVKRWLTGRAETQRIKQAAMQLVASCFYFDQSKTQTVQFGNDKRVPGT